MGLREEVRSQPQFEEAQGFGPSETVLPASPPCFGFHSNFTLFVVICDPGQDAELEG